MYYVNILLLIFYAVILLWIRPSPSKRKVFCVLGAANWIVLSGLRHFSVGADTNAYRYAFYNSKYKTWSTLFENFRNTIFKWNLFEERVMNSDAESSIFELLLGENALAVKDPGYAILSKAFYSICPNYTMFLIFIAIIFMIPFAILVYKHSREPLMSFLIYSCLFYSFFAITGHRQTIATGVALIAYMAFAERKKFIPFLLMILLVYPIHKSVIGFVPVYFLQYIKMDRKKIVAVLLAFPVVFLLRGQLTAILANLSGYDSYAEQFSGAGSYVFTFVYIVIMIVSLWKGEAAIEVNPNANTAMVAVAVAFLLTPTTFVDPSLMRLVQYYSLFLVLFIPDLVMAFDDHEMQFAYFLALAVLVGLFIKNNPQYMFFWQ